MFGASSWIFREASPGKRESKVGGPVQYNAPVILTMKQIKFKIDQLKGCVRNFFRILEMGIKVESGITWCVVLC